MTTRVKRFCDEGIAQRFFKGAKIINFTYRELNVIGHIQTWATDMGGIQQIPKNTAV